ncbi:hypothetical protein LTR95_014662 [Oleoguttula sp. CCFEE 5521]
MEVTPSALRDLPPAYAATPTSTTIRVDLRQSASLSDPPNTLHLSSRWARLLGTAVSREWLHSSGIRAYMLVPIKPIMSFDDFDKAITQRFRDGAHGEPLRWLSWVYVLRGRWLGQGSREQRIQFDRSNWENAKVAMHSMLDVRVDLVFTFSQSGSRRREVEPPSYELTCPQRKSHRSIIRSASLKPTATAEEAVTDLSLPMKTSWTRRACELGPLKGLLEGHRFPLQRDRFHAVPSRIWSAEMAMNDKARSEDR